MKRLLLLLCAAVVVIAVSSAADAQGGKTMKGTVTAISATSLSVEGSGGSPSKSSQTFTLDDQTEVYARGATRALKGNQRGPATSLISTGDHVTVTYDESRGALHATEVRVTKKASAK